MIRYSRILASAPSAHELAVPGGLRIAMWDRERPIPVTSSALVYDAIVEVASACFGTDMQPWWDEKARAGYLQRVTRFFLVGDRHDRLVGVGGYHRLTLDARRCVYLDATALVPELQGTGVAGASLAWVLLDELGRDGNEDLFVTMRTENPVVYHLFSRVLDAGDLYPSCTTSPPDDIRGVASDVARWLGQHEKLDPDTMRIVNAFDGPCPWRWTPDMRELPACRVMCGHPAIDAMFSTHLRPEDTFLVVARLRASTAIPRIAAMLQAVRA